MITFTWYKTNLELGQSPRQFWRCLQSPRRIPDRLGNVCSWQRKQNRSLQLERAFQN